jgi:hypothetical protein
MDMNNNTRKSIKNSGLLQVGALGAVAAAVVNSAVFGIGRAADVPLVVVDSGEEHVVDLAGVASMSVIGVVVGLVGAVLAYRFLGPRSLRPLGVVGLVIALVSNATFPGADATAATKWTLAAMHVVVGVVYLTTLEIVRARSSQDALASSDRAAAVAAA